MWNSDLKLIGPVGAGPASLEIAYSPVARVKEQAAENCWRSKPSERRGYHENIFELVILHSTAYSEFSSAPKRRCTAHLD